MYKKIGNCVSNLMIPPPLPDTGDLNVVIEEKKIPNTSSPEVWGEAFWMINHLGSLYAPNVVSPEKREKYWGFIDGMPEMLPCKDCSRHARQFVEMHRQQKDKICSSRSDLFRFFVDFHNYVNKRQGKPLITYEQAYKLFSGGAHMRRVRYE